MEGEGRRQTQVRARELNLFERKRRKINGTSENQ